MGTAKYAPADLCDDPGAFGRRRTTWTATDAWPAAESRRAAAMLQHHVAMSLRACLRARRVNQETLARELGWSAGRLSRAMSGAAPVSVEDLLLLSTASGASFLAAVTAAGLIRESGEEHLQYLQGYLEHQLSQVQARIADNARARPSTSVPPNGGDPASGHRN